MAWTSRQHRSMSHDVWMAVAERFGQRELAAAHLGRQQDAKQAGIVKGLDDGRRELRLPLGSVGVLAHERCKLADAVDVRVEPVLRHVVASVQLSCFSIAVSAACAKG
jgi:hypothetical protein